MNIPAELKYSKDHEWVTIEGDVATSRNHRFCAKRIRRYCLCRGGDP